MIGYHYTTKENWKKISKEGLKPQELDLNLFSGVITKPTKGTWIWVNKPTTENNIGSAVYHLAYKRSTHIVLLEVEYTEKDLLKPPKPWNALNITHVGTIIERYRAFEGLKCKILSKSINPERLKLIKEFNLMELFR